MIGSFVVKICKNVLEIFSIKVTLVRLAAMNINPCGVITIQERSRGALLRVHLLFLLIKTWCIEESFRTKKTLVMVSVDFSKAFDSVDRGKLVEVLVDGGCNGDLIDIITRLYSGDCTQVFCEGDGIGGVEVTTGIRQGCTGSPLLFLMVINIIIEKLCNTGMGYRDDQFYIPTVFYADDGLMLARSRSEAEKMMNVLREVALECGLEINNGKSQCVVYCGRRNWEKFGHIDGIRVTNQMKYLGTVVNDGRGYFRLHRKNKIQLGEKMSNMAYSVIARSCSRVVIGKAYWKNVVLPSVLSGSAMILWTVEELKMLQRLDNRVWRCIFGAPSFTPVRALQGEIGASSAESRDMKVKLGFVRHIFNCNNGLARGILLHRLVEQGNGRWISTIRGMCEKLGMVKVSDVGDLSGDQIKKRINTYEEEKWRKEIEGKSSLSVYGSKEGIREETFYFNDEASKILFRARTNTLALGWRGEFVGDGTECKLCRPPVVETLKHFVLECSYLRDTREKFGISEDDSLESVLLFEGGGQSRADRSKAYLLEIWKRR